MTDTIKPALSAEEWAEVEKYGPAFASASLGPVSHIEKHAVAALALHQQPFGFTRNDVKALREVADEWEAISDMGFHWARFLADRIEALLPPK